MIFIIDKSIEDLSADVLALFSECLFRACLKKQFVITDYQTHRWIENTILDSTAYLGDYSRQILKQEMEFWSPTTLQRTHLRNINVGIGAGMVSIEEMKILIDEPSEIVLENGRYDWAIIRKWASLYKKDRSLGNVYMKLYQSIENNLLRDHNAGGCKNIENVLMVLMPIYGNLYGLKLTTIFDRDKKSYDDQTDEHAKLKDFLEKNGVEYRELQKREMENYFPLSVYDKAKFQKYPFNLEGSDLDWDYVDVYDKNVCSFLEIQKSDIEKLCEFLTKEELESRVGEGNNEIKQILLHLAKYI